MRTRPTHTGQTIRELRAQLGITQAELADLLGTHPCNVSNWECGRVWPPGDTLLRVVKMLDPSVKIPPAQRGLQE